MSVQLPTAHALPGVVRAHGDHGAVGLKPHRVVVACGDHGDVLSKVGGDRTRAVHGDIGCGGVDIGDGVHIASPVDKLVAFLSLGHQADHRSFVIDKSPLSRVGYRPRPGTGDSEVIRPTTAHHPGN